MSEKATIGPPNRWQVAPVFVRETDNPADKERLVDQKLRALLTSEGIALLSDDESLSKEFPWSTVVSLLRHPLREPPHPDWEAPQLPRCPSCGVYYPYPNDEKCRQCVLLRVRDPQGIYDAFYYRLAFSDRYYREAFVKWAGDFLPGLDG